MSQRLAEELGQRRGEREERSVAAHAPTRRRKRVRQLQLVAVSVQRQSRRVGQLQRGGHTGRQFLTPNTNYTILTIVKLFSS